MTLNIECQIDWTYMKKICYYYLKQYPICLIFRI